MVSGGLLDGSTVVVAGVGRGLGAHVARNAALAGAAVVLGARSADVCEELVAEIRAFGGRATYSRTDVTSDDQCRRLIAVGASEYGGVDAVVANASASAASSLTLENADVDSWRESFDVNLFGSLRLVKAAIPFLRSSENGSVVFIGSQIVRRVIAGRGPYASSKAALVTAAQVLATELGPDGIRVNTLMPGRMWGPSLQGSISRLAAERGATEADEVASWIEATALKRLATDEENARAVIFLLSDQAAAITGQCIDSNAGETMR